MLLPRTHLDRSTVCKGIGVFLNEDIPVGQVMWKYDPFFTRKVTRAELGSLPNAVFARIMEDDYYWIDSEGNWMFPLDNDRFVNHSIRPAMVKQGDTLTVAARSLRAGEEITIDYRTLVPPEMWQDWYHL